MAAERLTKSLRELGLEKEEAEMYLFISAMGPTPIRVVARRFNLNRMKVYRSLKILEEKELVQKVMSRPVKYMATPMRSILAQRIGGLKQTLTGLEENAESLVEEWEHLSSDTLQSLEEPRFRIYQGRQQVLDLLFEMVNRGHSVVRLVTTVNDLARFSLAGLDDRMKTMIHSGVEIRILTQVDGESLDVVASYSESLDVRHITLQTPIRFAIVDEREALNTITMDDSMSMTTQADMGLWTDASNYVAAQRTFFDAVWSLAEDAESIIESTKKGIKKQEIKIYTTKGDYNSIFHDLIWKAREKIDLLAKNVTTLPLSVAELKERANSGVNIRVITQIEPGNVDEIETIFNENIINIVENVTLTDLVLLVVDEKEALMNIPRGETQKWTIWSNINAYVDTKKLFFNDYWKFGTPIKEKLGQISKRRNVEYIAEKIKSMFEGGGWTVETPGILTGKSWKTYMFDVLAKNAEKTGNNLCIDIVTEGLIFNNIIERSTIYSEITGSTFVLASLVKCRQEELKLAELYQIKIIEADTANDLVSEFEKWLKKYKSEKTTAVN